MQFFLSFRRAYKRTKNVGAQQDKMLAKLDEKSLKTVLSFFSGCKRQHEIHVLGGGIRIFFKIG